MGKKNQPKRLEIEYDVVKPATFITNAKPTDIKHRLVIGVYWDKLWRMKATFKGGITRVMMERLRAWEWMGPEKVCPQAVAESINMKIMVRLKVDAEQLMEQLAAHHLEWITAAITTHLLTVNIPRSWMRTATEYIKPEDT